jgi:hypothetical protein
MKPLINWELVRHLERSGPAPDALCLQFLSQPRSQNSTSPPSLRWKHLSPCTFVLFVQYQRGAQHMRLREKATFTEEISQPNLSGGHCMPRPSIVSFDQSKSTKCKLLTKESYDSTDRRPTVGQVLGLMQVQDRNQVAGIFQARHSQWRGSAC